MNVTNASETSTLTVDPALRASSSSFTQSALPLFASNASKVLSHGPGLRQAFVGQMNRFYVDCSNAGEENSAPIAPALALFCVVWSLPSHPPFPR